MPLFAWDREFERFYRGELVPYWSDYAVRPDRRSALALFHASGRRMDKRFVTEDIWARYIIPYCNNALFAETMSDLNLNRLTARGLHRPETLFKHMNGEYCLDDFTHISQDNALSRCHSPGEWILAPSHAAERGMKRRRFRGQDSPERFRELLQEYEAADYIVYRAVSPHPILRELGAGEDAVIRLTTLLFHNTPYVLSATIGVFDGTGLTYGLREDGAMGSEAVKRVGKRCVHVQTEFQSLRIPCFREITEAALDLARHYPYVHLVTWEFTVSDGADILYMGFDACTPAHNQEICGPAFGALTERVLSEIFPAAVVAGIGRDTL